MSRAPARVDSDVVWSGDVELDGDCIIGTTGFLRLSPGCRVLSAPGRDAPPPRLVVEGTLFAEGQPGRPVTLNAAVTAAGGWVLLSRCRLRGGGRGGEGLHLFGKGHRLERVVIAGFETGLFVRDGETVARRVSIAACPAAVVVGAGGRFIWEGGGVRAKSSAPLPSILVQGELIARGADRRPLRLEASLAASGGRVELTDCRVNGRGGEGLNFYGDGHRLERVLLHGFETGLVMRAGSADARDLTVSGERAGVEIGEGGRFIWDGGGISASGAEQASIIVKGALSARGAPERALRLDAALLLRGGTVQLTSFGLIGADGGALEFEALTISGCGAASAAARDGALGWAVAGAPAGRAVITVRGEFVARGARPFTLDASVAADGGRVELANCRLQGAGGEGLTLRGNGHLLEAVSLKGFDCALAVRDGAADARDLTVSGERAVVEIGERGSFLWEGGGISASGPARARVIVKGGLTSRGAAERALRLDAALSFEGGSVRLSNVGLIGADGAELMLEALAVDGCGAGLAEAREGRFVWAAAGAPAGRSVITVKGEFVARGLGSPFTLDASVAADGGRVELSNCRLQGPGEEGLTLRGSGHRLEDVSLEGFECALAVRDGAANARNLTIAGERAVVEIGEKGRFIWEGGGISASGPVLAVVVVKGELAGRGARDRALRLRAALTLAGGSVRLSNFLSIGADGGELALEALTIAGCGAGRAEAREGRFSWTAVGAPPGRAVITVKDEFVARGLGLPFTLDASVAADGGRVELANCRLEGRDGEGLTLRGGGHRLEAVSLEGFECALSVRDGETRARDLTVAQSESGVVVGARGRFIWEGGGARDGGTGALVLDGQAILRRLRLSGLRYGIRVEDGAAEIDGLSCRDLAGPGVGLHGTGYVSLNEVLVPGGEALAAASGHAHLAGPYEGSVRASASARLCVAPGAVSVEPLGALRAFVLSTGAHAFLGRAYRAAGAASISLFTAWARRQSEVVGGWVHRSWVAGGWEAGASDIDLALSVRELSSAGARRWLTRAQALHGWARRAFPALGELLIAEESEWRETGAAGLPRPAEWRTQARVVTGSLPAIPDAAPANARLGARLEAAMAYSRLMDVCFHPRMPEELVRREAAKAVVDLLRYLSDDGERGRALPREEFRAALSSGASPWSERLRALAKPGRAHRAACALAAAAARHWDGRGPELARTLLPETACPSADGTALRRALERVDGARRDFDGAASAAVFDTLHRSYLIVDPGLPEAALAEGIAAWARRAAVLAARQPLPILLTPRGWTAWRATAYQDFPLASAAWPRLGGASLEPAGRDFPGESRLFWGDYLSPPPSAEDAAAGLAQARAQFRVVRRLLAREAIDSPAATHHLLTRVACLALAGRGLPAPDFDLDAALAGVEGFAPRSAAGLRAAASGDWSGFEPAAEELLAPL